MFSKSGLDTKGVAKNSLSKICHSHTLKALLSVLLLILVENSSASDNQIESISSHNHLSWTRNNTRFDFVFNTKGSIRNITKLESDSNNYLTNSLPNCQEYAACLFKNGGLVDYFKIEAPEELLSSSNPRSIFTSRKQSQKSSQQPSGLCDNNEMIILHYCSTHWNPPAYLYKNGCKHSIEWHSPLTCHVNKTNYEKPCYIYDSQGNLIDLTPWIRSDGSSYKVNTSFLRHDPGDLKHDHSTDLKGVYINVCNEAYDMCGPNISACFNRGGIVDIGYSNMTSIKYDAKENNTVLLTSQGHYKEQCENSRVKTVIRFVCKKAGNKDPGDFIGPKLIRSDACTNVIEWETVHACPLQEIKANVLPDCKLKSEALGVSIDVQLLTRNMSMIEVPNVGSPKKKMILGLCKPLPKTLRCEGKQVSSVSACLIDSDVKVDQQTAATANNSKIVGTIQKASLRLADDRLYLEAISPNTSCSTPVVSSGHGGFEVARQLGVRVEFICSNKAQSSPSFLDFKDCVYTFEWGSPLMCFESMPPLAQKNDLPSAAQSTGNNKMGGLIPDMPANIETLSPRPPASDDMAKNATDQQRPIPSDTNKITNGTIVLPNGKNEPFGKGNQSSMSYSTSPINQESTAATTAQSKQQESTNSTGGDVVAGSAPSKMKFAHKFFMISLILMTLIAFLVVILFLDNKTRLRVTLSSIRRQARSQPQTVPYSRVIDNDLDL